MIKIDQYTGIENIPTFKLTFILTLEEKSVWLVLIIKIHKSENH